MMKAILVCLMVTCCISTAFGIDGFGVNATGGAGGAVVTATTPEALKTYAETIDTPYIIQVSGTLDLAPLESKKISIRSNKTIRGIGVNPTIIGQLGFKKPTNNVIIERLTISCPNGYGEGNGLCVKEDVTNVFITKCTIYNCYDGLVDITRRSDWVTVSWCKFYFTQTMNSQRVSLVGSSDDATDDYGKLHITYHHNWFGPLCWQRIPSVRFGKVHIYNNYYDCPGNLYGVWSRIKAECLIENNYFKGVNDPYSIHVEKELPADYGKISASGNAFENCTGVIDDGNDTVFAPTYTYTADTAVDVPAIVQWGAGADGRDGLPPHWFFGYYGDFDRSGLVDMDDLVTFVGYWLDADNIEDADYNDDGKVDNYEFALFAANWLKVPDDVTPPAAPTGLWALGEDGQASVDWDDNNTEPDFAGYNLYRTTTSGSGYVKLNTTLLTNSNYTDTTVVNGTMYYYIVKAVDTIDNESGNSVEGCAQPGSVTNLTIQESAVGFCSVNGIVDTSGEHAGYTGSGYLDTTNTTGSGANWRVHVDAGGLYTLIWRYANGAADRPARLLVNTAEQIASISFAATGAWENWSTVTADAALIAGDNDIRLEATSSGGLANVDYLRVNGSAITAVSCQ